MMFSVLGLLCFLYTVGQCPVSSQISECRYGWVAHAESCYLFAQQPATWPEAEEYCMSFDAYLTEITSKNESDFLEYYLRNHHTPHIDNVDNAYWIGGNDIEVEGRYRWSKSDLPLTYTDWQQGQPDDQNNEDCMELRGGDFHFHWNDLVCDEKQHFLCEMPKFNTGGGEVGIGGSGGGGELVIG